MSGGVFTNRPFEFNPKCIVFALAVILLYIVSTPNINMYLVVLLFVSSYVSMAWYDELYDCDSRLKSGTSGPGSMTTSLFKPMSESEYDQKMKKRSIYWFHLLMVTGPLIYAGLHDSNPKLQAYLVGLGGLSGLYHGMRLIGTFSMKTP